MQEQASGYTQAELLLQGLPAQHVIADKGYDSNKIVDTIELSSTNALIPPRSYVKDQRATDFALYAKR